MSKVKIRGLHDWEVYVLNDALKLYLKKHDDSKEINAVTNLIYARGMKRFIKEKRIRILSSIE